MSASALAQFGTRHIARGIGRLATEVIESGSGSYVTMVGGRKMVRTFRNCSLCLSLCSEFQDKYEEAGPSLISYDALH